MFPRSREAALSSPRSLITRNLWNLVLPKLLAVPRFPGKIKQQVGSPSSPHFLTKHNFQTRPSRSNCKWANAPQFLGLPALLALCAQARYNFHKASAPVQQTACELTSHLSTFFPAALLAGRGLWRKWKCSRHSGPSLPASPASFLHSKFLLFAAHHLFRKSVGFSNRECAFSHRQQTQPW